MIRSLTNRLSSSLLVSDASKWVSAGQRFNLASLSQPETSEDQSIKTNEPIELSDKPASLSTLPESVYPIKQIRLDAEERFKHMLKTRLDDKNFKSLAYKQDELNKIIAKLSNLFNMFHLLEAHCNDFSHVNFVKFVKHLTHMLKDSNMYASFDKQLPAEIKSKLSKIVVKHAPHLDPYDCYCVFQRAGPLGFDLNDSYTKCVMQLLKYHVNELDISHLIKAKQNIIYLKGHTKNFSSNEYLNSLEKAIDLSVQIKFRDLDSVDNAVKVLKYFSDSLSDSNFKSILEYVNQRRKYLSERNSQELEAVLAQRGVQLVS